MFQIIKHTHIVLVQFNISFQNELFGNTLFSYKPPNAADVSIALSRNIFFPDIFNTSLHFH